MNIFVVLPLQESMAQHGACKHDQWQGYMAILVVNHGIIKSISIVTAVIRPMMKFHVNKLLECFRQEVKWTLAIRYQLSTLSALDLDRVHHLLGMGKATPREVLWRAEWASPVATATTTSAKCKMVRKS
jgi:hypothetical protein